MTPISLPTAMNVDPTLSAQRMNERFSSADVDGSGAISKSEFTDALAAQGLDGARAEHAFSRLDTDGDGTITQQEQRERFEALTDRLQSYGGDGGSALDTLSTLLDAIAADSPKQGTADQAQSLLQQLREGAVDPEEMNALLMDELPTIDVSA